MVHDTIGGGCPSTIQDIFTAVPSAGLISVESISGLSKSVIISKQ